MKIDNIVSSFLDEKDFELKEVITIEEGYINKTFCIKALDKNKQSKSFILQRINTRVFKYPDAIMNSMLHIAHHLQKKQYPKAILFPLENSQHHYLTYDEDGFPWRMLPYIDNSQTIKIAKNPHQAFEAAKTFSEFYAYLWDLEINLIKAAIPDFLNFQARIDAFLQAKTNAPLEKIEQSKLALNFLLEHITLPNHFIALQNEGKLPMRIIHADPKLSNVLFDVAEKNGIAVIDLDTVMQGSLLYDFGDMIRSYTNNLKEDDPSPDNVFNPEVYEAVYQGFIFHIQDKISQYEIDNLLYSAQVVVFIQAIRFLTDFLEGDIYYQIDYPKQNLNRAMNQIHLLKAIMI